MNSSETAKLTYAEELNFIDLKWGHKEVEKFMDLSESFLKTLSTGTFERKLVRKRRLKMSVIPKQTSIYYKVEESNK